MCDDLALIITTCIEYNCLEEVEYQEICSNEPSEQVVIIILEVGDTLDEFR